MSFSSSSQCGCDPLMWAGIGLREYTYLRPSSSAVFSRFDQPETETDRRFGMASMIDGEAVVHPFATTVVDQTESLTQFRQVRQDELAVHGRRDVGGLLRFGPAPQVFQLDRLPGPFGSGRSETYPYMRGPAIWLSVLAASNPSRSK